MTNSDVATSKPNGSGSPQQQQQQQHFTPESYLFNLQEQNKGTIAMMRNLFHHNAEQRKEIEDKELDLRASRDRVRFLERQLETANERNGLMEKNQYTLVLIDGDGMIFTPQLLAAGRTGGLEAARNISTLASEHCGTPAIVKVFCNVDGLQRALKSRGSATSLREFAQGFTDPAAGTADFVDVGEGKEMADEKIKNELRWHLKNYNCAAVLLGISHDNGYARVLAEKGVYGDGRITLIEGVPMVRELAKTGVPKVRWGEVFDNAKIDTSGSGSGSPAISKATISVSNSEASNGATAPPPGLGLNNTSPKFSYAAAAASPPSPHAAVRTLPASANTNTSPINNRNMEDIVVSRDAMIRIKSLNPRPCNNFYLKGECMFEECRFSHDYKLKPDDLNAMKKLAKGKRCVWGEDCTSEKCYYGHGPEGMALGGLMA